MLASQRIIHDDGGVLEDKSVELNNLYAANATVDLAVTTDYLYIGSDLPFNHRYFQVSTANTTAAVVSVQIWDGNSWADAVDVIDQTSSGGKPFAVSGIISWARDRDSSWGKEETTENVTGLTSLKIYDLYWARLKVSASLSATTALAYVGHKFANDDDLGGYYPDLVQSSLMDAFETSKTNWDEQHVLAAEEIIQDIRRKGIAWNRNQILNWEQFGPAAVHKVASIIMAAFGNDYKEARGAVVSEYAKAMNLKIFEIDQDEDGRLDETEKQWSGGISRS